jgi:Protein of unknown function (DUF3109)
MIVIQDILISSELVQEQFHCNLSKCKGACCTEGDYGAPLSNEEMQTLDEIKHAINPFLPERSQQFLSENSGYEYYPEPKVWATSCHEDGACVYLTHTEDGIGLCGIEQAYQAGAVSFVKPISCHLYPIRVSKNDIVGFEAWNYDRWDICSDACSFGKENKMPIYRFLKSSIIRAKGQAFYDELDAAAQHMLDN